MDSFFKKFNKIKKEEVNTLFIITKSNNSNILNYLKVNNENIIEPKWWMYEKQGIPKEEITFLEKTMAYGVNIEKKSDYSILFNLIGYPKIKLELINKDDTFRVFYNNNILLGLNIHINNNLIQNVKGLTIYYINNMGVLCEEFIKNSSKKL